MNIDAVIFALVLVTVPYLIGFCHAYYLIMTRKEKRRRP